jgi:hypothetical protein
MSWGSAAESGSGSGASTQPIEVQVDGALGGSDGDVERVHAGNACEGNRSTEQLAPDAAPAIGRADIEVGELHLIAAVPDASNLEDTHADQRLRVEHAEEDHATVEAVQQHGRLRLDRIRPPAGDLEVSRRVDEPPSAQLVDIVMHFGAIDRPDELTSSRFSRLGCIA